MKIPRLVIAGTNSGVGKTTIATGIMAALTERGLKVQAYKTGPDYIDPGYHTLVTKRPSRNLDAFMLQPQTLATLFVKAAANADVAIIEGVMGLFDGGVGGVGSTANLSKQLKAPVILIVDVRSMADSAAALVYGFARFDPEVQITGVILNRVGSERHYRMVKEAIEDKVGVPVLGYLTKNTTLTMPERHLGLLPVEENNDLQWYEDLANQIERSIDLERMLALAHAACPLTVKTEPPLSVEKTVRVAVARDEAFTFYYQDGLDELESLGVELVPFSPLRDAALPKSVCGILFGGGFPEMFVKGLSTNRSMQDSIREAHRNGMPIYAECGGLMYLCREIADFDGASYPLVGLVPAVCQMQKKLITVGYVEVEARQDTVLCSCGKKLCGHEFHFSTMEGTDDSFPWAFTFRKLRDGSEYPGGYCDGNLLASYLHCHFAGNPEAARYFVDKCMEYKKAIGT